MFFSYLIFYLFFFLIIYQFNCFDFQISLTLDFCFVISFIVFFCFAWMWVCVCSLRVLSFFRLLPPSGCVELKRKILFHCFPFCIYLPPVVVVYCWCCLMVVVSVVSSSSSTRLFERLRCLLACFECAKANACVFVCLRWNSGCIDGKVHSCAIEL